VKILQYPSVTNAEHGSELENRVEQLVMLAKALANEIETLQVEISTDHHHRKPIDFEKDGIDFYNEIKRYEIELIRSALNQCDGNQTQAARLLRMKSTTLNAKMKHYGLNPVAVVQSVKLSLIASENSVLPHFSPLSIQFACTNLGITMHSKQST